MGLLPNDVFVLRNAGRPVWRLDRSRQSLCQVDGGSGIGRFSVAGRSVCYLRGKGSSETIRLKDKFYTFLPSASQLLVYPRQRSRTTTICLLLRIERWPEKDLPVPGPSLNPPRPPSLSFLSCGFGILEDISCPPSPVHLFALGMLSLR